MAEETSAEKTKSAIRNPQSAIENRLVVLRFIVLPFLFLTVALLGGLRLSLENNAFVFLRPSLVMLVCALVLMVLLWRGGILRIEKLFSEEKTLLENGANVLNLLVLFAATTQVFNAVLPESGLFFRIVSLFFLWTLWNNLFADFKPSKLIASLAGMFGFAFILKHLILSAFSAPTNESWWRKLAENFFEQATLGAFAASKFSEASGYITFFALVLYFGGLLILLPKSKLITDKQSQKTIDDSRTALKLSD